MKRTGAVLSALLVVAGIGWWLDEPRSTEAPPAHAASQAASALLPPGEATFVGSQACQPCHAEQWSRWAGSHHAQAMQEATPERLPKLQASNAALEPAHGPGVRARFIREQSALRVEAEGPAGKRESYTLAFTFGVAPLQQYLVPFPGGRLQALPVAWDSRSPDEAGQRWIQLYPEVLDHRDQLHWTGLYQTWNMMCAECHVTGYVKAYDALRDSYASRWSELGVGCEACHGPGSVHVQEAPAGLAHGLNARGEFRFRAPGDRIATRVDAPSPDANGECAPCHARAGTLDDSPRTQPRTALSQHHRPALLLAPDYWPTGEQRAEVFVWGSFAASKMAARGVTCGDCHEPHAGTTLAEGNALCVRCHQAAAFDAPAHHHHAQASEGARCVSCHMPAERFMLVDDRRDHSFQIPRPDLTLETGSPNACNRCHARETPAWAARALDSWSGQRWRERPHWARAFAAAERHSSAAQQPLAALALDRTAPAIVRASALRAWQQVPRAAPEPALLGLVDDLAPLVRAEALPLLERVPPEQRWRRARAHLDDEDRLVRLEAAELLCGLPREITGSEGAEKLRGACAALLRSLEQQADFPANATQLAHVLLRAGDSTGARAWLERALARDPQFAGAYLERSELERVAGDQAASARVLEAGLARLPDAANLHHASGLALVRLGKKPEALKRLARAVKLAPDDAGLAFTYAVALQDQREFGRAVQVLEACLHGQPENGELLEELLRIGLTTRDAALVRRHLPAFEALFPQDPSLALLRSAVAQR